MVGGREYSNQQRKIISRRYKTLEPRSAHRLGELVSELYLADDDKARNRLWKQVATAMKNLDLTDARCAGIIERKDTEGLAALMGQITR